MASLTGNSISSSYTGLLKTNDNGVLSATEQVMTDGSGNSSTLSMGTASASFTGTLDLSGATVTGLPSSAPGLVLGSVANSMKSAAALSTTPAIASADQAIALGSGANASGAASIVLGGANASGVRAIKLVKDGNASFNDSISIGFTSNAFSINGIAIGRLAKCEPFGGSDSIAIGTSSRALQNGSVALGLSVQANKVNTVSVTELETQLAGGGITMKSPNGTEYKLTVSDAGALVIT